MNQERSSIFVDATKKIDDYLKYRKTRLNDLYEIFEKANGKSLSRGELYEKLYGSRNLKGVIRASAYNNLDLQIDYYVKKGIVTGDQ